MAVLDLILFNFSIKPFRKLRWHLKQIVLGLNTATVDLESLVMIFVFMLYFQANTARKYGARVYCVGVKDFNKDQVSEMAQIFPQFKVMLFNTEPNGCHSI